jgi:L-lysine epsilon oxidase C-terminal domain
MRQVAIAQNLPGTPQPAATPSFVGDIWPILERGIRMLRVAANTFGAGDHGSLSTVVPPGAGQDAARAAILGKLANPGGTDNVGQPNTPDNMPLLYTGGPLGSDPADIPPTLRPFQYTQMAAWSAGAFVDDWPPVSPTTITPDGLTRAALENCVGASLFPGIEATVTANDGSLTYTEAFRLDQTGLNPGDVTKGMARPWQADFTDCSSGGPDQPAWWPAARPDSVYPQGSTTAADWTRGIVTSIPDMVANWFRLGFIVDPGTGLAVETERTVVCKDCFIITDRDQIGEEEATAVITANQEIQDAFYVVVEGFAPSDLGISTANPNSTQLQAWAPTIAFNPMPTEMSQRVNDMLLEDDGALGQAQRITFGYNFSFTGTNDFTSDVVPIEVIASIQGLSSNATIDLTQVDSPYMDHGSISYLSDDTRVFKLQPGQSVVGAPALGTDPLAFIQGVLTYMNTVMTSQDAYAAFEALPALENAQDQLEWNPTINMIPVFNFALCRVRYRATVTTAPNVRVFFRLFQTAATGTEYNSATTYRVGGGHGVKIPLLGIQGGELVTIPFFAEARKAANINLNNQTDTNNVQNIAPAPGGTGDESYMYYGCWLDINQPNDPRFPIQPSPPDGGPFTGPLLSVADLIRGTHQCMVTEISFDLDPVIPAGVSTANCERLSQRNLAIDNSDNPGSLDTHRVQHTFAIHPTTSKPLPKQGPDELMIAWGNTPPGSLATVYLPGVRVSEVLDLAARNFNLQTLERVDDHTVSCRTGGVTYIPIPADGALDLAGLITVDLPASVRRGQNFKIVLRQIVHTPAPQPTVQHPVAPQAKARGRRVSQARTERRATPSRHILGAFEFAVQVKTAKEILPGDERNLTAIERAAQKIPPENRWYPVFQRYIGQLRGRVAALGGGLRGPTPGTGPGPGPGSGPEPERISYEGKVSGLLYDRFGDFEGFSLETEHGERKFFSREKAIAELAERAWGERLRIEVRVEPPALHRPRWIVVRGKPVPFHDG